LKIIKLSARGNDPNARPAPVRARVFVPKTRAVRRRARRPSLRRRDLFGVEFVQLLDIFDDARHLRRVERDFLVGNFQMRELGNFSNVHKLVIGDK
jgi:hypothetical protein